MLKMLKEGYSKKTEQDRLNYGLQLRSAMEEFAEDFLPHMKEEEEVRFLAASLQLVELRVGVKLPATLSLLLSPLLWTEAAV